MIEYILLLKDKLTPPKYRLEGECKKCGRCCRLMYSLDHYTTFDFKVTQFLFPDYKRFEILGKDEQGNYMYRCKWIQDDNTCKNYKKRLTMCKNFPNVKYGSLGETPEGCGYKLVPIKKFADVLDDEISKNPDNTFLKRILKVL
ncbi:MAG: YkgJ family cysteine cluster protein [Vampirovibrionia bacterium]